MVMLKICGYTESDCDLSLHLDLFFLWGLQSETMSLKEEKYPLCLHTSLCKSKALQRKLIEF